MAALCVQVHMHICVPVSSPEVILRCHRQGVLSTSLATGSVISLELASHILLTGQEALDPFAGACHHTWLFYVGSGNPTQVSLALDFQSHHKVQHRNKGHAVNLKIMLNRFNATETACGHTGKTFFMSSSGLILSCPHFIS